VLECRYPQTGDLSPTTTQSEASSISGHLYGKNCQADYV
jgi:hypothetical protein